MSRNVPGLEEYTFPSTGVTIKIRKVSPLLSQEVLRSWKKSNPEPEPPHEEINYGREVRSEPNYSAPSYLQARRQWVQRMDAEVGERTLKLMIERGVEVDLEDDEVTRFREEMRRDFEIDLSDLSDKYVFVAYMAVGTDKDLEELRDAIITRSQPTEEATVRAEADFRRKG